MSFGRKRVVIDTSSLIAVCLYPDRAPAIIYRQALQRFELVATKETLAELSHVLSRSKFDRWRSRDVRMTWLENYADNISVYAPAIRVADCRDAKDDKFLDAALAAKADVIVCSDDDLWVLHPYRGIDILSLQAFAQKYLSDFQSPNTPPEK